ncbi:MAG TPA: hypothetical protein VNW95_07425 [Mucilaginibacter sp.]|jgi:hypothetical protein|nr:hypothetical protein [Mucilaginibacter sp.]
MQRNIYSKITGLCLVVFTVFVLPGCSHRVVSINGTPQVPVDLNEVIAAMKVQFDAAKARLGGLHLIPVSASVTVQVTKAETGNGDVSVLIFKPSYTRKVVKSSSIAFDLQSPSAANPHMAVRRPESIDYSLADLIVASAKSYSELGPRPIPGLEKQDFVIDVVFSIENDGSAGISFKVLGMGVDAGYEYNRAVQHELKLTCKLAE